MFCTKPQHAHSILDMCFTLIEHTYKLICVNINEITVLFELNLFKIILLNCNKNP